MSTNKYYEQLEFEEFLKTHGIDPKVFTLDSTQLSRYYRLNPFEEDEKDDLAGEQISWLPEGFNFFRVDAQVSLKQSSAYQKGLIYGMDVSSGFCIAILNPQPKERILDLCCAPGAKLALIADRMQRQGSITGVDISKDRIASCRKLFFKYQIIQHAKSHPDWRVQLVHADGRYFQSSNPEKKEECVLDTSKMKQSGDDGAFVRVRKNKSARARERREKRKLELMLDVDKDSDTISSVPSSNVLYDRVLVDAECSHDGSLKHLIKMQKDEEDWKKYLSEYLNSTHLQKILKLQLDLLRNGFRLLKENGTLVYSTCSLSYKQNEETVDQFLKETGNAKLLPIEVPSDVPLGETSLPGTIRFTPLQNTSGLYIAKITKRK